MRVKILKRSFAGAEFAPDVRVLKVGGQSSAGVEKLEFELPAEWQGLSVTLHVQWLDGTLPAPVLLDDEDSVAVDKTLTASPGGQWMLLALGADGYRALTKPTKYECYSTLNTDGDVEISPTQYETFVARVLEYSNTAQQAAASAKTNAETAATAATRAVNAKGQAETAARTATAGAENSENSAARAEAAAARAEAAAPETGKVVSVNGKAGIVRLTAQDVGALPCPAQPVAGQLLRVLSTDPDTGAVRTDTTPPPDLTPYVRSSTVPTAAVPGAVKADPAFGVTVRADGTLATAPADEAALDAMADPYAPLTPALLPYGVKKALTAAAAAAPWSAEEKSAARRTLGVELASYYTKEDVDALLAAPSLAAYPVGSIYQSVLPASPAALFGGTWEQIAQDRVLMGASDSHKAGSTVEAGLPNITGQIAYNSNHGLVSSNSAVSSGCVFPGASIRNGALTGNNTAQTRDLAIDASRSSAVYGRSDTVQPAAYYVYIWLRVA